MIDLKTDLEFALDGVDKYIDELKTRYKNYDVYQVKDTKGNLVLAPLLLMKFEISKALVELKPTRLAGNGSYNNPFRGE